MSLIPIQCSHCKQPGHNRRTCPTRLAQEAAIRVTFAAEIEKQKALVLKLESELASAATKSSDSPKTSQEIETVAKLAVEQQVLDSIEKNQVSTLKKQQHFLLKALGPICSLLCSAFVYLREKHDKIRYAETIGTVLMILVPGIVIFYMVEWIRSFITKNTET